MQFLYVIAMECFILLRDLFTSLSFSGNYLWGVLCQGAVVVNLYKVLCMLHLTVLFFKL